MIRITRRSLLTIPLATGSGLALLPHGRAVARTIGNTPHLARTAPNRLSNPTIDGTAGWTLSGGAVYVTDQARKGQGSFKVRAHHKDMVVSRTYRVLPAGSKDPGPADLVEGDVYTFSFYMKSLDGPKFVFSQIGSSVKGAFHRNVAGAWYGSTRDGVWEECAVVFKIPTGEKITGIAVQAGANESTRPDSVAYVTDFYLGEGFQFADPPSPKRPFNGKHVQIDELGNWTIRGKQLFPIFLYTNLNLPGRTYEFYTGHGDASIWEWTIQGIKKAWAAGLYSTINLSHYTMPKHSWGLSGNTTHLQGVIREIDKQGLSEAVIGYYLDGLDNPRFEEWQSFRELPKIRTDLEQLLPVFRKPHWTFTAQDVKLIGDIIRR